MDILKLIQDLKEIAKEITVQNRRFRTAGSITEQKREYDRLQRLLKKFNDKDNKIRKARRDIQERARKLRRR